MKSRKALILACRAQCLPYPGTSFGDQILSGGIPQRLWDILEEHPYLQSPLFSNLILEMVLSAPMPQAMVTQVLEDMVAKEVKVMETTPLPSVLNYAVFFEEGRQEERLHPSIPPNAAMASLVHGRLVRWLQECSSRRLYPRMSSKTISIETARRVHDMFDGMWGWDDEYWAQVSQQTLEWLYCHHGIVVGGPCEMRQKWYYANAVPRTYYAGGGEAYEKAKYLQEPFNLLVNSLACTERYSRVNPSRLRIREDLKFIIYDLSSFTSNCHEQRRFLEHLASFASGTMVEVFDGWDGPKFVDLGELIRIYTDDLNNCPRYSMEKIWNKALELEHHQAGFLGVFGNISSCMFLHGAVVLQVCLSEDELNVAGDDGLFPGKSRDDVLIAPRLVGVLAEEKCGVADEPGSVHLKRPIMQVGQRVIPGRMLIWPHTEILYFDDTAIDPRYPYMGRFTKHEIKSSMAGSISRFLYHLSTFQELTSDERSFVLHYLELQYCRHGLPIRGSLPQCGGDPAVGFVPELSASSIGHDPFEYTIRSLYRGVATLPMSYQGHEDEIEWYKGAMFTRRADPRLSYLYKMGFLSKEMPSEVVVGEIGLYALLEEYNSLRFHVYTWNVCVDVPSHLKC